MDHPLNNIIFTRRIFSLDPLSRSLARISSYAFVIILCGAIVSFGISDVVRLKWAALLLSIMVIDWAIHVRKAHYTLRQLINGSVPKNNIALCLNRKALQYLLHMYEHVQAFGGSPYMALLLRMIEQSDITRVMNRLDVDPKEFRQRLEIEYHSTTKTSPIIQKEMLNNALLALTKQAGVIALTHGREDISEHSLYAALFRMQDVSIEKVIDIWGLAASDIESAIVQGEFLHARRFSVPNIIGGFATRLIQRKTRRVNRSMTSRPTPLIDQIGSDLTNRARRGDVGFLIGHQDEYAQMISVLARETKRNVILIGDPGTGKEAIVHRLAVDVVNDAVPESIFDTRVIELSIGSLLAREQGDGAMQQLSEIVEEIMRAGNIVLYIPDIHLLAKATQKGSVALADTLAPIIKSDTFPIIGATYQKEFKEYLENNPLFSEEYEVIRVNEINQEEAEKIITYEAIILEKRFGVFIHTSAIKQAVLLAGKYLRTKKLPSSAQELLREVVADATYKKLSKITGADIISAVEKKTHVPIHRASGTEAQQLLELEKTIHQRYIDQQEAVTAVANALRAYRSGLSRKGGPMASFLFVGPTGVGKTELSKLLADATFGSEKMMVRFDMSEYQMKENITRFIGSPDGSIAGALTESVMQRPYSLILFDELEKAHPDLLNLFLQVLDEGRLTDGFGRVVDFQNTIIIATSNAHSTYIQEQLTAGTLMDEIATTLKKKLSEYFRPELLNRFSDIVVFKSLSEEDIQKIAQMNIEKLCQTLSDTHGITLKAQEDVVAHCARLGFDPMFGARPLRKVLDTIIIAPLSKMILSQKITKGQTIKAIIKNSEIEFIAE